MLLPNRPSDYSFLAIGGSHFERKIFVRNAFLKSVKNSVLETIFKPFGLKMLNKTLLALGLYAAYIFPCAQQLQQMPSMRFSGAVGIFGPTPASLHDFRDLFINTCNR